MWNLVKHVPTVPIYNKTNIDLFDVLQTVNPEIYRIIKFYAHLVLQHIQKTHIFLKDREKM